MRHDLNPIDQFEKEKHHNISRQGNDHELNVESIKWIENTAAHMYSYNFYMDEPTNYSISTRHDCDARVDLEKIKPDLIIETGIAHGGSLILNASMLALLDMCDAIEAGVSIDPAQTKRKVLGIDIDIREHNKLAIESHPMASRITMIQGSSIESGVIRKVKQIAEGYNKILVCLDSNHTHDHVLAELEAYAQLNERRQLLRGLILLLRTCRQTCIDRPWGPGNNPKTAVWEYRDSFEFEIDKSIQDKLLVTVAPDGFLKRKG